MPVESQGQTLKKRNPPWARDEIILALDTYFSTNILILSVNSDLVIELSNQLNKLNAYDNNVITDTYRNPNGVHMKLMNFYSIENPGKGLANYSKLDKSIYLEFCNDKAYLHSISKKIKDALDCSAQKSTTIDDEGFLEGKIIERLHKSKERNQKMIKEKKRMAFRDTNKLECEVCGFDFKSTYGVIGDGFIECHHKIPLSEIDVSVRTKLIDLALVCSNCHSMLHRNRPWLSIEQLKETLHLTESGSRG